MPKAFNEKEKELIRHALLEKGKQLFGTLGLKKTGIEDLTKAVGIAQGSFYHFFESKEALYFEIIESEEEALKAVLMKKVASDCSHPREAVKSLLTLAFKEIEHYPIIKQLYTDNGYELLLRKLPLEKIEAHISKDSDILLPFIQKLQDGGVMIQRDPAIISGLLRSLFMLTLHKKEIGEAIFDETLELLIEVVSKGLIREESA